MKSTLSQQNLVVETKQPFTYGYTMLLDTVRSTVGAVVRRRGTGSTYLRTSSPTVTTRECSEQTHLLSPVIVLLQRRVAVNLLNLLQCLSRREPRSCRCPSPRRQSIFLALTRNLPSQQTQTQVKILSPAEVLSAMRVLRLQRTVLLAAPPTCWVPAEGVMATVAAAITPHRVSRLPPVLRPV